MNEDKIKNLFFLKDFVYGGMDGVITTFSIISGVVGADLSPAVILILGFANLLSDGFSMCVGNMMSVKTEKELYEKERIRETNETKTVPEEEIEDIRKIYRKKGFKGKLLESIVKVITSKRRVWVDTMMKEELGLFADKINPLKSSLITITSFISMGIIPLLSFIILQVFSIPKAYAIMSSTIMTFATLFIIGSIKGKMVSKNPIRSGFEVMLVGGIAAAVAYITGYLIRRVI